MLSALQRALHLTLTTVKYSTAISISQRRMQGSEDVSYLLMVKDQVSDRAELQCEACAGTSHHLPQLFNLSLAI